LKVEIQVLKEKLTKLKVNVHVLNQKRIADDMTACSVISSETSGTEDD